MEIRPEVPETWGAAVPDAVFFRKALSAVRRRKGLIHGKYKNGGVCALGALGEAIRKTKARTISVRQIPALELQRVNDSVPKATPARRRAVVIRWLEQQLKRLSKS